MSVWIFFPRVCFHEYCSPKQTKTETVAERQRVESEEKKGGKLKKKKSGSGVRLDRCSDTSDRKIIHRDASLDTRFISLPSFRVSSRVCLYSACVCVTPPPRPLSHTHRRQNNISSQSCPSTTFCFITSSCILSEGEEKRKKEKEAPSPEPNPITRNRM